jgi:sacsin
MSLRFTAGLTHLEPSENYQQYFNKELDLQCRKRPKFGFDNSYHSRFYHNKEVKMIDNNDDHIENDDSNELVILLLQLLYESQNTKLCTLLAQSMKNHSLCLYHYRFSLFDMLCVSYFLNNANITWNHLDLAELNKQQTQLLSDTLTIDSQHNKCKTLQVKLGTMEAIQLFQLPFFQYIQECYVTLEYHSTQCNPFLFLVEILKKHLQLKTLHLFSSYDNSKDATALTVEESSQLTELINNSTLQELVLVDDDDLDDDESDSSDESESSEESSSVLDSSDLSDDISLSSKSSDDSSKLSEIDHVSKKTSKAVDIGDNICSDDDGGDSDDANKLTTSLCNGVAMNKTITTFVYTTPDRSLRDKTLQKLLMNNHTIKALGLRIHNLPPVNTVNIPLTTLRLCGMYTFEQLTTFFLHVKRLQCLILPPNRSYPPNLIFQFHASLQQLEIFLDTAERANELFTILQSNDTLIALRVNISNGDIYNTTGESLCNMLRQNQTIAYIEIRGVIDEVRPSTSFLSYLTTGLSHNISLQELSVKIPISHTNNEQMLSFFNTICTMNNLTELKLNFELDQLSYSNCSSDEEAKQILTTLYYEHGLTALTYMIISHSSIKLLDVRCSNINSYLTQGNWVETVKQLYQAIFYHPSLEYVGFQKTSLLEDILDEHQNDTLIIDKPNQQQPLKQIPTIELMFYCLL